MVLFFLEKINGRNLFDYVNDNDGINEQHAIDIFLDIVNAVSHIHSHNISHHDLKTQNIMYDEENGIAKVVDYGLSVPFEEDNPLVKSSGGSPLYSAPEVLLDLLHDPRLSDVWSLGIILYFMLTKSFPFGIVQSFGELVTKISDKYLNIPYPLDQISLSTKKILKKLFVTDPVYRISLAKLKKSIEKIKLKSYEFEDRISFYFSPSKSGPVNEI